MTDEQNQRVNTKVPNSLEIFSYRYPVLSNLISFLVGAMVSAGFFFLR